MSRKKEALSMRPPGDMLNLKFKPNENMFNGFFHINLLIFISEKLYLVSAPFSQHHPKKNPKFKMHAYFLKRYDPKKDVCDNGALDKR